MVIKTYYKLEIQNFQEQEDVTDFVFNTLPEVKQFLKKINNVSLFDGNMYGMDLYRVDYTWNLSTGVITSTSTRITQDF